MKEHFENIRETLKELEKQGVEKDIEVECRIRKFLNGNVLNSSIKNIVKYLPKIELIDKGKFTVNYYSGRNDIKYNIKKYIPDRTVNTRKTVVLQIDYNETDIGCKFEVAIEEKMKILDPVSLKDPAVERFKYRKYRLENVVIDVRFSSDTGIYIVELELSEQKINKAISSFNKWSINVTRIISIINKTKIIYTISLYHSLLYDIKNDIGWRTILKPVTMRKKHLSCNYLFNRSTKFISSMYTFYVGYKADGIRGFIILYNNKIWWINTSMKVSLIIENVNILVDQTIIIECERVDKIFDKGLVDFSSKVYMFLAFDMIRSTYHPKAFPSFTEAFKGLRKLEFKDRLSLCNRIVSLIELLFEENNMMIQTKKFYSIGSTPDKYFEVMNIIKDGYNKQIYPMDGLIFIPNELPNLLKSKASHNVDIIKWKPPDMITIDLKYKDGTLIYFKSKGKGNKDEITLNLEAMGITLLNFNGIDNKMYEFKINVTTEGDIIFEMFRPRPYKEFTNTLYVIKQNIEMAKVSITFDDLIGNSSMLFRSYNSTVRFKAARKSIYSTSMILDIGAGKGSLVNLYKVAYVVAIEPDDDNRKHLKKRITDAGLIIDDEPSITRKRGHVLVLDKRLGEVTDILNNYTFNVILMFNVIHFLNGKEIKYIYKNLIPRMDKRFSTIVGSDIDGKLIGSVVKDGETLEFDHDNYLKRDGDKLIISMDMPTLQLQEEKLIDLLSIVNKMYVEFNKLDHSMKPISEYLPVDKDNLLMSKEYRKLTSLYYTFIITNLGAISRENMLAERGANKLPSLSDDEFISIGENFILIGCLGNKLLHCLLKAVNDQYILTNNITERENIFDEWIIYLSSLMNMRESALKNITYSESKLNKLSNICNVNIGIVYRSSINLKDYNVILHTNINSGFIVLIMSDGEKFLLMASPDNMGRKSTLYNLDILNSDIKFNIE